MVKNHTFTPLYGKNINTILPRIYVETIHSTQGVLVRNILLSRMGTDENPIYRLKVDFTLSEKELAIAQDNSVARKQVQTNMQFTLYRLADANHPFEQVAHFTTSGTANYSTASEPYIIEVSKSDANQRALKIAVQNGILRLASYFYNNPLTQ